ncbi:MAG: DUF2927 domain-containing protein [Pseudolabrys sp.]
MRRLSALAFAIVILLAAPLHAASTKQPPPPGAFRGAPAQFTRFSTKELVRGFMALAFGSDLRVGARPKGVRRYPGAIRAYVAPGGSADRVAAMQAVIAEYGQKIPNLKLTLDDNPESTEIVVHLIDEKDFKTALENAFGRKTARAFVNKTDPQCMTSVKSQADGVIVHSESFVIVDQGNEVFLDCAYHELLHAFGLSNHDQRNPWTTLNQNRMVGYLTVYDRALLTLLYDPALRPGMTAAQVRAKLPELIKGLHVAGGAQPGR